MANTGTEDRTDRVLHIRFRRGDEERVRETLQALDRGERPAPYLQRVYHDPEDLHRVTRPKNLELLRAIARERPEGIRATARLVGRDVRQVHRNLEELADLGLVEFEENGQSKRPTVWYDEIDIQLPLDDPESTGSVPERSES